MNIGQTHLLLLLRFIFIDSDFNYTQPPILGVRLENIHNFLIWIFGFLKKTVSFSGFSFLPLLIINFIYLFKDHKPGGQSGL